tara:strand:- start:133 stop:432 length:300 start_codon:yes stop_codon:yes gene_type:complete
MAKYLKITTTNDGDVHIPIGDGLLAALVSATVVNLYSGIHSDAAATAGGYIKLTCTGATQALIDNINTAQVIAAETGWQNAVVVVTVPSGQTVADYEVV